MDVAQAQQHTLSRRQGANARLNGLEFLCDFGKLRVIQVNQLQVFGCQVLQGVATRRPGWRVFDFLDFRVQQRSLDGLNLLLQSLFLLQQGPVSSQAFLGHVASPPLLGTFSSGP